MINLAIALAAVAASHAFVAKQLVADLRAVRA